MNLNICALENLEHVNGLSLSIGRAYVESDWNYIYSDLDFLNSLLVNLHEESEIRIM